MTLASTSFRTLRRFMAPRWLTNGEGGLVGYALDLMKDAFAERLRLGHLARFPQNDPTGLTTAPDDALTAMGRDRRVVKGIQDTNVTYAAKLVRWLEDRPSQGNPFTLMRKLAEYTGPGPSFRTVDARGNWYSRSAAGAESAALKTGNWNWDGPPGRRWSRFWVIVYPNGLWGPGQKWSPYTAQKWGATAASLDGSSLTLGSTATQEQVATLRALVSDWKPAHARCVNIIVAFDASSLNPASPEPNGSWGQATKYTTGVAVPSRITTARYLDGT